MEFDARKYIDDFENFPTDKLYRLICMSEINDRKLTDEDRRQLVIMRAVYDKRIGKLHARKVIRYIEQELPKMGQDLYREGAEFFLKYLKRKANDI